MIENIESWSSSPAWARAVAEGALLPGEAPLTWFEDHEHGRNPAAPEVLLDAVVEAGLDRWAAGDVLGRDTYADEVRIAVRCWQRLGIDGVPATVIDGRQLIAGAQPVEVYEQSLRRICARSTA